MPEKTIAQKLLVKPGHRILTLAMPEGIRGVLAQLPDGATVSEQPQGTFDQILLFVRSRAELEARLADCRALLAPGGLLWVTYPKGTSKIKADINRDSIYDYALGLGLQGVAMIAIDDTWSALRLKRA